MYFILVLINRNSLKLSKEDYVLSPRIPKRMLISLLLLHYNKEKKDSLLLNLKSIKLFTSQFLESCWHLQVQAFKSSASRIDFGMMGKKLKHFSF